jgi:hypothetical protein
MDIHGCPLDHIDTPEALGAAAPRPPFRFVSGDAVLKVALCAGRPCHTAPNFDWLPKLR